MVFEIYPLTIITDRYGGTYSGGKYLAFNIDYHGLTESIDGSDGECMLFWREFKQGEAVGLLGEKVYCGKGSNVSEALFDLIRLMNPNKVVEKKTMLTHDDM